MTGSSNGAMRTGPLPPDRAEIDLLIEGWRAAWAAGDWPAYAAQYGPAFKGDARTRGDWEAQRRRNVSRPGIDIRIERVEILSASADRVDVRFVQHYRHGKHRDVGAKSLVWHRSPAGWRITAEHWTALRP